MEDIIVDPQNSSNPEVVESLDDAENHVCEKCLKMFKRECDLRKHESEHLDEKPFPCDHCNLRFASKERLYQHRRYASLDKNFTCVFCKLTFKMYSNLKVHLMTHTQEKPFKCEMCNKNFRRKNALRYHYGSQKNLAHHKKFEQFKHYEYLLKTHKPQPYIGNSVHTCEVCNKQLKTRQSLKCHAMTHENLDCNICGVTFKRKDYVEKHKQMAHNPNINSHPCDVCQKMFGSKYSVKLHKAAVHEHKESFKCELCPRVFYIKSLFDEHIQDAHVREKEYPCMMCDKKYATLNYLKCHMREHTGEKPYVCDVCNESFIAYDKLRTHFKWCKKSTSDKKQEADNMDPKLPQN